MAYLPPLSPLQIVERARVYIGTPYIHNGRLLGVGVDCAGLLACVWGDLGVVVDDPGSVPAGQDNFEGMLAGIAAHATLVTGYMLPSDVIVFRSRLMPNHVGILAEGYPAQGNGLPTMVHAYGGGAVQRVVESPLDPRWMSKMHSVWRYRNLA